MKGPLVNLEEKIDKTVGHRSFPSDSFEAGMRMQDSIIEFHNAFNNQWAPRGVYRFKTHEEANEWMMRMLAASQIKRS